MFDVYDYHHNYRKLATFANYGDADKYRIAVDRKKEREGMEYFKRAFIEPVTLTVFDEDYLIANCGFKKEDFES